MLLYFLHPIPISHSQPIFIGTMQISGTLVQVVKQSTAAAAIPLEAIAITASDELLRCLATANAVVVFGTRGCCMCHVATSLLFSLGVGPTIIELDHHSSGDKIKSVLCQLAGVGDRLHHPLPAVFVGGKYLGGIETLMACHINGTLIPLLKEAGALWL